MQFRSVKIMILRHTRTVLASLLGLGFLATAAMKVADWWGFLEKLTFLRASSYETIVRFGHGMIGLEICLGFLLLFQVALPRFTLPLTELTLLVFSGGIWWAWEKYGIEDCGCFGSFAESPPWMGIAKNMVMLVLVVVCHVLAWRRPPRAPAWARWGLAPATIAGGLVAAFLHVQSQF